MLYDRLLVRRLRDSLLSHPVRAGVLLVSVLGALAVAAVAVAGWMGLEALQPSPAASLDGAALHAAISPPSFAVSVALVAAAALLVGGVTMWISGRDFTNDLRFVDAGLEAMAHDDALVASIPLRTLDELGALVRGFEALRQDFGAVLERERELRRDLERADAVKAEFLKAVSHELRTPLNSILGFADVLLEGIDGPLTEAQREDLAIIRSAGEHLLELFNDVFDLSAAVTDQLVLQPVRLKVGPVLEEVARELRGLRRDKPVAIVLDVHPEVPDVEADPKRLRQIITNLASNALKFTDEGEVRLRARLAEEGWVSLEVIDTGPGIPEEAREDIFLEFGQGVSPGAGRRRGGAGLGLAISKRLVELHGGTLRLRSEVGRGSTFEVRLRTWERPD